MKHKLSARLTFRLAITCVLLFAPVRLSGLMAQGHAVPPDPFAAQQRQSLANNPARVTFTLHTVGDKKQFKQGGIITLELKFSSTHP